MEENKIKELLKCLNYIPKDGTNNVYIKNYSAHNNYKIEVDFNNKKINYGDKIVIGNATTSNFSKPENFVVLECVNRLLEKGYKPQNIELEKIYPAGHGHSGNLDILVYSEEHTAYLMIECKTDGCEYNKEHNKMLKDGGQLFTYYALDRDAKYLCLYSSIFKNGEIKYKNSIISVSSEWRLLSSSQEIYLHWNKFFKDNGIFEEYASPYEIKHKALTYGMLTDLKEEDSGKIFNQIMEILRHNVVSDKPNAFNKLLNLFVCKIIDENRNEADELKFQWLDNDTDESLQMRLNDLYKDGMSRFLNINVTDYSEKQVDEALQGVQADESFKQTIKDMLINTRLKKSPNFAFKEVLDEKSFKANAIIVREIVELLQGYKFRYKQKHQFLGDFFELLLNTSMKQEAGQFFTPVPITRFIISSLPIRKNINDRIKNNNNDNDILPTVIDYAIGSGHFLTEYMEQVQNIINDIDDSKAIPTIKNKIKTWRESEKFSWAKDYVYGIDLDDRLVKTAKVSAFFNGDGEANIIWANGLANFLSDEYIKKLKHVEPFNNKNNSQFDILISNPPYSVEAFKTTLKDGENTFELYNYLTDNSSEIECLFVERMKQLLKVGGWAGVILPVSILSNSGIYSKTREIIFKYFKVKAIVELGSSTFMKTGTNTIILFLERRVDNEYKEIENSIDKFFNDKLDVTVSGIENVFSKFVSNVYDDLTFDDYIKIIEGNKVEHELYNDYKKEYSGNIEYIKQIEKEKLLYFILTYNQEIVVIKTGKKQEEKKFLGYEFSERRGHEGLKWLPSGTKLYNESNLSDKTKANYYIYNAFWGTKTEIDESLSKNIFYKRMSGLFEYGTSKFDKKVNLNKKNKIISKFPLESFTNLFLSKTLIKSLGYTFPKRLQGNKDENLIPFYKVSDMNTIGNEIYLSKANNYIDEGVLKNEIKGRVFPKGATAFPSVGEAIHTNKKRILSINSIFDNNVMAIWSNDENTIMNKYLYYFMLYYIRLSDYASQASPPSINNIGDVKIPVAPIDVQQKIVEEIEEIEKKYNETISYIQTYRNKIENIFNDNKDIYNASKVKLHSLVQTNPSKSELNSYDKDMLISFIEMANISNEGYILNRIDRKLSDVRNGSYTYFVENDIILAKITPCMENGKCAVASGLTNNVGMGSSEFHVFRCCDKINNKYLFTYLNRDIIRKEAEQNMTGASGHRRVPITFYENLDIPLPSIEKQQKIVSEIEKYEKIILDSKNKIDDLERDKKNILNKYL